MKHQTLLLAEDEQDDIFFVRRAMQKAGISNPLLTVNSGPEVIEYLTGTGRFQDRQQYPEPALLLLDLKLPRLNGIEILKWVRQDPIWHRLPAVVLTSSILSADVQAAYDAGANSYAVKPSNPEELVQLMRDFAGWWLNQHVPPGSIKPASSVSERA